jgi:hypothetical protein
MTRMPNLPELKNRVLTSIEPLRRASWLPFAPVGEGEEFRSSAPSGASASALVFGDCLVHFGAVTGVAWPAGPSG